MGSNVKVTAKVLTNVKIDLAAILLAIGYLFWLYVSVRS
jgi:hypothetical protein